MDNKNNKCNIGFQSKYAFIDNQNIHIDNYINEFSKNNKNVLLKCSKYIFNYKRFVIKNI